MVNNTFTSNGPDMLSVLYDNAKVYKACGIFNFWGSWCAKICKIDKDNDFSMHYVQIISNICTLRRA